ncbi:MAG TPA: hypothetical protein VMW94_10815 [Actinomycetes bacterium]|nr:hypothetical protein [Actinomycetes bacterium]
MSHEMTCWQSTTSSDFGKIATSDDETPQLPPDTVAITEAEYGALLADFIAGQVPT